MRNHPDFERYLEDWQQHTGNFVRNPYLKNPKLYFKGDFVDLNTPTCRVIFHLFLLTIFSNRLREKMDFSLFLK